MRRTVEKSHREVVTYSFTAREVLAALEAEFDLCLLCNSADDYESRDLGSEPFELRALDQGVLHMPLSLHPGTDVLAVDLVFESIDEPEPASDAADSVPA